MKGAVAFLAHAHIYLSLGLPLGLRNVHAKDSSDLGGSPDAPENPAVVVIEPNVGAAGALVHAVGSHNLHALKSGPQLHEKIVGFLAPPTLAVLRGRAPADLDLAAGLAVGWDAVQC